MKKTEQPSFIDTSLARGLRRQTAAEHWRSIYEVADPTYKRANSWEGNTRRLIRHVKSVFGDDNIHVYEFTSKRMSLLNVIHSPGGFAVGIVNENEKKRNQPDKKIKEQRDLDNYVPVVFKAHFVERFLQSRSATSSTLALLMYQLWQASKPEMIPAYTGDRDIYPIWRKTGEFAFATAELLVLGFIPQNDDLVCQTVIRSDRLEAQKMRLWQAANSSESGLFITKN